MQARSKGIQSVRLRFHEGIAQALGMPTVLGSSQR
jgi:hypothetical protein